MMVTQYHHMTNGAEIELPDPSLVGVCLVIETSRGPRFVFNYPAGPPGPLPDGRRYTKHPGDDPEDPSTESSEGDEYEYYYEEGRESLDGEGEEEEEEQEKKEEEEEEKEEEEVEDEEDGQEEYKSLRVLEKRLSNFRRAHEQEQTVSDDESPNPSHVLVGERTSSLGDPGDSAHPVGAEDIGSHNLTGDLESNGGRNYSPWTSGPLEDFDEDEVVNMAGEAVDYQSYEDSLDGKEDDDLEDWERLYGFTTPGLEKMLTPPKSLWHKMKFEVSLHPICFLGHPVYIRDDGRWRKVRQPTAKEKTLSDGRPGSEITTTKDSLRSVKDITSPDTMKATEKGEKFTNKRSSGNISTDTMTRLIHEVASSDAGSRPSTAATGTSNLQKAASSAAGAVVEQDEPEAELQDGEMIMFHVVFVLNPPKRQYLLRIKEMYENVAKKFAKILKYEQARCNYVGSQAELILDLRSKGKQQGTTMDDLWHEILTKSSLALAMAQIFHSISASQIAHVSLGSSDISLQIPSFTESTWLPTLYNKQLSSVWLSSSNIMETSNGDKSNVISQHSALLLLVEPEVILKELDKEYRHLTELLAHYLHHSKPTMSFQEVSIASEISLHDIRVLALHLIHWRRARVMLPLHHRCTYIVSPLAPMESLTRATKAFANSFHTLPSLPEMLAILSSSPRPYNTIIPTKDHRNAYMDILAWLFRGKWVVQLRSFGLVRVPPIIKYEVSRRLGTAEDTSSDVRLSPTSSPQLKGKPSPFQPTASSLPSSNNNDIITVNGRPLDLSTYLGPLPPGAIHHNLLADLSSSLIASPYKANKEESLWLETIRRRLPGSAARKHWPIFLQYFNGTTGFEEVATREGLGRKDVARLLATMGAYLQTWRTF